MDVQTIVNDVKGRVEPLMSKGQAVVNVSAETLKKANGVLVSGVQSLLKTQVAAGKDLLAAAQSSFEKARKDGLKAVAASPIKYLPDGNERVLSAYNDTVTLMSKTGGELAKVVRQGFDSVSDKLGAAATAPKPGRKRAARKTANKAGARKSAA